MTTEELLNRVEARLNGTGNPPLPPEETMRAILDLMKEREDCRKENLSLTEKVNSLETKLSAEISDRKSAELDTKQAIENYKEKEWMFNGLGRFIGDVANGLYAGQEIAAANRVYDLNKKSLRKVWLNAYNYESLDEAERDYNNKVRVGVLKETPFEEWLYSAANRG